jgi:hypothetical protein
VKKLLLLWVVAGWTLVVQGQGQVDATTRPLAQFWADTFPQLLAPDSQLTGGQPEALAHQLQVFIGQLQQDRREGQPALRVLRHIRQQVHQHYLKTYAPHSSLGDVLVRQHYNCLSGSLLFAIVLENCGFRAKVYETSIHAYVQVSLADGQQVLIETTDPAQGLIVDRPAVEAQLARYQSEDQTARTQGRTFANHTEPSLRELGYQQMVGLLFYNEAVGHYNQQRYEQTVACLQLAMKYYEAERNIAAMLRATGQLLKSQGLAEDKRQSVVHLHAQYSQWFQKISTRVVPPER